MADSRLDSSNQNLVSTALSRSRLDESQRGFCSNPSRSLRLLAPAGSGKTYSLLWRCLNLCEVAGEDKPRFLLFTFTRAARDELVDRLRSDSAFQSLRSHVEITTLNSWGYRRLRARKHSLKLCTSGVDRYFCMNNLLQPIWQKYPRIKDLFDSSTVRNRASKDVFEIIDQLKTLGFRHDLYRDEGDLKRQLAWLNESGMRAHAGRFVGALADLEILQGDQNLTGQIHEHFMLFWCEACQQMFDSSLITLEDQKYWAMIDLETLVREGKHSTGIHRVHHILVDEFQDINALDLNLLKAIAGLNKCDLTIVGDDDQAIFEWRGATPDFVLRPDEHIGGHYYTHVLDINYRSPRNIVSHSQKLIKHNRNRVDKNVSTSSAVDAMISIRTVPTLLDSVGFVVQSVRQMLEDPAIKNVAIIGRKRSQIIPYQIVFASEGIPFYAAEDLQVFLSDAFNDLKQMLAIKAGQSSRIQLAMDPVAALLQLCDKVKHYPLNRTDRDGLNRYLRLHSPSTLIDAVKVLRTYSGTLKGSNKNLRMSGSFSDSILGLLGADSVAESIDAISDNFGGLQRNYGKSLDDIFYADPPFLYLSEYAERYGDDYTSFYGDIEKAISTLVKIPPEDNDNVDQQFKLPLHLMTALRAKGKEFDVVIVLDANSGIWPSKLATTEAELEQERRLFYVAVTRPRKQLILLVNESILGQPATPTPYLAEMGLDA